MTATTINTLFGSQTQLQATLTIEGRDSGARLTVPVTGPNRPNLTENFPGSSLDAYSAGHFP